MARVVAFNVYCSGCPMAYVPNAREGKDWCLYRGAPLPPLLLRHTRYLAPKSGCPCGYDKPVQKEYKGDVK